MMIQTGIDLIEVARIAKSMQRERFMQHVFSPEEQVMFEKRGNSPQTVAANFAAKEAFAKALGTGVRGFALNEISLLRDELGKPYFQLSGNALEIVQENRYTLSVSVTHTKDYASAVVVCYGGIEP
ncbi:holo-ACP synthase [Hydrogenoanaerobacterium sp.]|uniref:holo-ACP synthase n=1 Tax=Hydrogenoanaerobacterium sp. TaxID=2953763 RepID=UPI0028A1D1E1|nr:holo-ACP synthase [Hydrogenoanaerobacterium sp.]